MRIVGTIAAAFAAACAAGAAQAGDTFDAVKARGELACGVSTGLPGFSFPDTEGNWSGLDVDVCRAVAAAVFGDAGRVSYRPLSAQQRFIALQSGEVDLLSRNTTVTLTRDTAVGLDFAPVVFYDGQAFLVPVELGLNSAVELDGASVCVQTGTTTELNLADFFRSNGISFEPVVFESLDELRGAFFAGRCDAFTGDSSGLASTRTVAGNPDDYEILPDRISKEPLAPATRHGDNEWTDVVRWVVNALIQAEESGITSANVDSMRESEDPTIKRLLGVTPGFGEALGLDEAWAYNAIVAVGNYGEMFERNVGAGSPLGLERGLNALYSDGGLMYAAPAR